MGKLNYEDIKMRIKRYQDLLKNDYLPQEISKSEVNYLCCGEFSLMHAQKMTFRAEKFCEDGDFENALYVLGVIETILSSNRMLSTDKMFN